ncbi:ankyrin repeat domain-containing protein SOWAHD [Sphaeramia orbicularis]|uniref:ankyrin repeat domain-containing protein SOWAHD n=1 Tax=Sphaeramia orbicularis TaxID=375764 RepID=UPI00117C114F|nr:ankyrin repeat domain-containing protein SOWAHD [Sphaeramia orbicularis]XP_030002069.1 ankyrin repeat domain-containing protein SOWAHD [Sphaeramia orbicularis]
MYESGSDAAGCDSTESKTAVSNTDAHGSGSSRQGTVVERLSRYGMQVMPSAFQRRSRLQRQQEVPDSSTQREASITPAMRKKYLKELLLNASHGGFSSALSSQTAGGSPREDQDAEWALYPMEHAWMLSAVEGNYETILEFISEDPHLLTRRDFISGYSVLHWLAKRGQDETLIKLLRYAESEGIPVNVNLRGSGGLTPLHLASMHGQYMVIKLLVGAFGANVDAMDYNGKRAWQYLKGDAPLEMKELLGTWDDEHCSGCVQNVNRNINNNSAGAMNSTPYDDDEVDGEVEDEGYFDRTKRTGSWRFGSFRKLLNSFPFLGNKT